MTSLLELMAEDMRAWKRAGLLGEQYAKTPLTAREVLIMLWRFLGLRATIHYRVASAAAHRHIPLVPMILAHRCLKHYGLDIVPWVDIGPGLYIPHPVGTVIMAHRIGARCSIIGGITIGMRNRHEFPVIGDDVFIGTGARVLGGIVVGNGAQIGANAVVVHDVPANATVVGIPAHTVNVSHTWSKDVESAIPMS